MGQQDKEDEKGNNFANNQVQVTEVPAEQRDATHAEIKTFPHVIDHVPTNAWIVCLVGSAERVAYYSIISIWQNYMQHERGSRAVPGALGLGQSTATTISNAYFVFMFLTPMFLATLSDAWLGRYRTLLLSLCRAGDQYVQKKPQMIRQRSGDFAIVDGQRTLQFLYNTFYWFTNIASLSSIPATFLEREFDFWTAYLLATVVLILASGMLVVAGPRLGQSSFALLRTKLLIVPKVKVSPQGNNLPKAIKVLNMAARNGFQLDRAKQAYQMERHGSSVPWSDDFVAELKTGLIACRVIFSFVFFYLSITQMYNNLISQAGQMNLHGVPNDMIQATAGVASVLFVPLVQALYNALAKHRIAFGAMARVTVAFLLCGCGMAYAAALQKHIYNTGPCYDAPLACPASEAGTLPNDVNVWTQLPVYVVLAVAEIFGLVTASEYAYSKAPKDMRSIVQALVQLSACFGAVLGMALSPAARDPYLTIMYASVACVMGVCSMLFWWRFRKYDNIDHDLNNAAVGDDDRA
ncbi:hypothetical protein DL767_001763 [Monosporascus sp. MG133]|nr:hypothetical protein DL767_001763 [Monosporascus sp. MG133]